MVLIHKKMFREDRLLQIAMALSLLRIVPDMLQSVPPLSSLAHHPLFEQHSAAMDYHAMTREQVLHHLSRELLTRLHPEELRNLLNSQMPVMHHPDYGDPSGDLIDHQHDLGGTLGERRWRHHAGIGSSFHGPPENLFLADTVPNVSMKDRDAIIERLMALAGGNINARLNGIFDDAATVTSDSLRSDDQSRLPSTHSAKIEAMTGSQDLPTEPLRHRREIFDVQAYALVGQTSVIPNSTSSNGSRDNVLHSLSNPTPPSSVPASPPASPLPQPPTALLNASTPPQSPAATRDDLPSISSLGDISVSSVSMAPVARNFNGGRFPLLGLSTTGLRINEGILLPEDRAAWPYIDEYTIEDRALLQALWLQDQDLGVPRDVYEEQSDDLHHQVEEQEAPLKNALLKGDTMMSGAVPDPPLSVASRDGGGGGGQPTGGIREAVKNFKEEPWNSLNFTLDAETGEHCPSLEYHPEDLKLADFNYTGPTDETQNLPEAEPQQPSSESCLSASGHGSLGKRTSLYSAYDHLLCEERQTSQQSQSKLVDDIFQEAADALLHEAITSEISENIPTLAPLNAAETELSNLIPEVKTEESFEVNDELVTNATSDCASDPARVDICSQNLSTILGEEVSGLINSFADSIPPSFSAGLFNNSDLNISLNEFDFEGFPDEESQVVNDNGPQSGIFKEENTTDTQELSLGDSPFFFPDFDLKSDDFANQSTELLQHSKRPRRNASGELEDFSSILNSRIRRPSSSASSGHGTLSDDSEGDTSASNQPSASSLEQAFDLFNSIVNSNNSNNLDTSSSNNSGGGNFNSGSDLADLGIGPESVDLGSLASLNCLNSSLDEMIQASNQHNRASQGRMGGMLRGGSMDQRWQDLASLLSLPSPSDPSTTPPLHPPPPPPPPTTSTTGMTTHHHHHHHHHHPPPPHHHHHHQPPPPPHLAPPHHNVPPPHQQPPPTIHHPHALYPAHEGVGGGSVPRGGLLHNATLPPALPDPHNIAYANSMGASGHLGASSSGGNNPNVSEHLPDHHHPHPHHQHHQYKMETSSPSSSLIAAAPPPAPPSHPHDMLYYQSSGSGAGSSELASTGGGHPHPSAGGQHGDGFLSSILGEDDLQLMDMAIAPDYPRVSGHPSGGSSTGSGGVLSPHGALGSAGDYSSGAYRGWNLSPDDQQRLAAPVAQKKHHMFGKRYFQDVAPGAQPHHGSNSSSLVGGGGSSSSHYAAPYQQPPSAMDTTPAPSSHIPDAMEPKYSYSMDFRGHHEVPPSLEHIHHNHTYHLSPEGPSGLPRVSQRDPSKSKPRKPEPERALTRDEKRARALNLPISCDDIIHLPMDEFNERISKYDLTENQLSLIRDIRRRGKNKVAAQNCRKRKLDQIMHLAEEVKVIQSRKNELVSQYEFLSGERIRVKHKFSVLYRHIFQHLRDSEGQPYSPHEYNLQQSGDGSVLLVPKSAPHVPLDPGLPPIPSNSSKPDDDSSKGGRPSHQQPPHQHHTPH